MDERKKPSLVREHIERCIELYGMPIDSDFKRPTLAAYEQMRADLMMLIGMAAALSSERAMEATDD